jgi:hypothetical protein
MKITEPVRATNKDSNHDSTEENARPVIFTKQLDAIGKNWTLITKYKFPVIGYGR